MVEVIYMVKFGPVLKPTYSSTFKLMSLTLNDLFLTTWHHSQVRPGQILFEFDRVPRNIAVQAMTAIQVV